jgi:Phosphotransferase enzyme family
MAGWRDRSLLDLLTEHGLDLLPEREFPNDGWSGATFTGLEDPTGRRFVLKRTSLAQDWIARATHDDDLREGWLAALSSTWLRGLWGQTLPYIGAASDGDGVAILMPDLSDELIAWERPGYDPVIDRETLSRILRAIARLHSLPWPDVLAPPIEQDGHAAPPWCPLPERLTLLTRASAEGYAADANPVGERFLAGWDAFDRTAPDAARDLVSRLGDDLAPLVTALDALPARGLHGDLKFANVALFERDAVGFIDWQMTLVAPVAVELGWLLVSNSASLAVPPDVVLTDYRSALAWDSDRWGSDSGRLDFAGLAGDWDTQVDLTWIVGLLLRGWRKGLDAEAGVTLPSGVTAADDLAWWSARATEAAGRRL